MLRQWWVMGNLGGSRIVGLFAGRDELFELFGPVENNYQVGSSRSFGVLGHEQEPLAVRRNGVGSAVAPKQARVFKQKLGAARKEGLVSTATAIRPWRVQ